MTNLFKASTRSVAIVHALLSCIAIIGVFFIEFTLDHALMMIASFFVLNIIGMHMMMHRYYSHSYFKFKSKWLLRFFTLISILCTRGSPIGWVYVHRMHHAKADTHEDPIGPISQGFKLFGFYDNLRVSYEFKMNPLLVKSLMNKEQVFINTYYWLIVAAVVVPLMLVSFDVFYFIYVLPILMLEVSFNLFNYFNHKSGYKNYHKKDQSTNNFWLWFLNFGEAWHNNHHGEPSKLSTHHKWWEIDPVVYLIKAVAR
jgi:fatty-acid desaturase